MRRTDGIYGNFRARRVGYGQAQLPLRMQAAPRGIKTAAKAAVNAHADIL